MKQNSGGCDRCIMVSDFLKIPTNRMRWRLPFNFKNNRRSVPLGRFIRAWKRKFLQMVRKFPTEISFGNCRVPPEFPNGIVGQLPCHSTSDRNFWIFWPNGKHPKTKANHSRQSQKTNNAMKQSELEASTGKA